MSTSQAEINLQKDNSDSSSSSNLYLQLDRAYIVSYVRHAWINKNQLTKI